MVRRILLCLAFVWLSASEALSADFESRLSGLEEALKKAATDHRGTAKDYQ
jgi:hypothetical protein